MCVYIQFMGIKYGVARATASNAAPLPPPTLSRSACEEMATEKCKIKIFKQYIKKIHNSINSVIKVQNSIPILICYPVATPDFFFNLCP